MVPNCVLWACRQYWGIRAGAPKQKRFLRLFNNFLIAVRVVSVIISRYRLCFHVVKIVVPFFIIIIMITIFS